MNSKSKKELREAIELLEQARKKTGNVAERTSEISINYDNRGQYDKAERSEMESITVDGVVDTIQDAIKELNGVITDKIQCNARTFRGELRCELLFGHEGPHQATHSKTLISWGP